MKHSFYEHIALAYLLFLILGISMYYLFFPGFIEQRLVSDQAHELVRRTELLSDYPLIENYQPEKEADLHLEKLIESIADAEYSEIWLTNQNGEILARSQSTHTVDIPKKIPNFSEFVSNQSTWVVGSFQKMFPCKMISVIVPVSQKSSPVDYILVHYACSQLTPTISNFSNVCFIIMCSIYLLSLLLPIAFHFFVYRPLRRLVDSSIAFANGNTEVKFPPASNNELAVLQANLTYMANEINQTEEYQKKFISNISHDFRSPLTSIQGYAQAMIDGTIPPEAHEKYLQTILKEAQRLSQMTQNVLDFHRTSNQGILLEYSVFSLHNVIHEIVASMEIQARKKDIQIRLRLSKKSNMVSADKAKIQQVIYNLLDNAIKFSNPHSDIIIASVLKHRYVYVSIKDFGAGIPQDQIPKIWNRFYKSDSSRGKDKTGTGLGLAIVKEIIREHDQNINVISTKDAGTEFIFSLDKA